MGRVVVVLEGGLVQDVHSDDPSIQVAVLDHDVFQDEDPKLDLDEFFRPHVDLDLAVLNEWKNKKTQFCLACVKSEGE